MQYKIREFNKATGSALVQFYTDELPEGLMYNVDIPIVDGQFVSGETLNAHIMGFAPFGQISRLVELRSVPDPELVIEPFPIEPPADVPPSTVADKNVLTSLQFMDRFTETEQLAIVAVTMASPQVKLWYDKMIAATEIVLADPRLTYGLQSLVDGGLISQARMDEILPVADRSSGLTVL